MSSWITALNASEKSSSSPTIADWLLATTTGEVNRECCPGHLHIVFRSELCLCVLHSASVLQHFLKRKLYSWCLSHDFYKSLCSLFKFLDSSYFSVSLYPDSFTFSSSLIQCCQVPLFLVGQVSRTRCQTRLMGTGKLSCLPLTPNKSLDTHIPFQKRTESLLHFGNEQQSQFSCSFTPGPPPNIACLLEWSKQKTK